MTVAAVGGLAGSLAMTPPRPAATAGVDPCSSSLAAMGVALAVMGLGSWPVLLAGAFVIGFIDGPLLVALFTTRSDHSPAGAARDRVHRHGQRQARRGVDSVPSSPPRRSTVGRPVPASSPSAASTSSPPSPGVSFRSGSECATRHVAGHRSGPKRERRAPAATRQLGGVDTEERVRRVAVARRSPSGGPTRCATARPARRRRGRRAGRHRPPARRVASTTTPRHAGHPRQVEAGEVVAVGEAVERRVEVRARCWTTIVDVPDLELVARARTRSRDSAARQVVGDDRRPAGPGT